MGRRKRVTNEGGGREVYSIRAIGVRPSLSVIVTSYNSERTLPQCLASIRNSEGVAFELIVVDDQSGDRSLPIAETYADRVIVLKQHKGRNSARKAGFAVAVGEIVVNIDSDVCLRTNTLAVIKDFFALHPAYDAVTCKIVRDNTFDNFASAYKSLYMYYVFSRIPRDIAFIYGSCFACRATVSSLYDPPLEIGEDTAFGQGLVRAGKHIAYLPEAEFVHNKYYSLATLFRNDFLVPRYWVELLFFYGGWRHVHRKRTVFSHASVWQLTSLFVATVVAGVCLGLWWSAVYAPGAFLCVGVWLSLHLRFFLFLIREKGCVWGVSAVPFTFLDELCKVAGIIWGVCASGVKRMRAKIIGTGAVR